MLTRLLTSLYAAQGLPFGFFTLAVPVILRDAGWSLIAINLLQVLGLPWVLKFMWAPWMDRAVRQHGARRRWLLWLQGASISLAAFASVVCLQWPPVAQSGIALSWVPLAGLFALVLSFNLLAATQDVLTDGLAVRALSAQQRGWANGIQVGAYRLGMVLGGGGLLWWFAQTGWSSMLMAMAVLLMVLAVPVWFWRQEETAPPELAKPPDSPSAVSASPTWLPAWWHRVSDPGMRSALWLIVCYRLGDQMVSGVITPFLADLVADKATVAWMKGTVGSTTSLFGALLGGLWLRWVTRRTALLWAGLAQVFTFLLYLAVSVGWGGMPLLWAATILEGLLGTLATVALFAWMMDVADPQHAGADYTLMASAVVLTGSVAGFAGAVVGDLWGYTATFAAGTVMSIAGIWAMVRWQDKWPLHARVAQAWGHAPEHATTASVL